MSNIIQANPIARLPENVAIKRLTLPVTPNTNATYVIPDNTTSIYVYEDSDTTFKLSYDGSATDYHNIAKGAFYYLEAKKLGGKTLYIQSPKASAVIVIESWY